MVERFIVGAQRPREKVGNYFIAPKTHLSFISTGSKLLDLALGGGWAEGRICNVVGDKSTGKCGRDFYILTGNGLELIDDIGRNKACGVSSWQQQLALDRDRQATATHFYRETVSKTHHVETEHGFDLIGTDDHKVQVLTPDLHLVMRSLSDIRLGDYAVIAPATEVFGHHSIFPAWGCFLGFLIADGTLSSGPLVISSQRSWVTEIVVKAAEQCGCHLGRKVGSRSRSNEWSYTLFDHGIRFGGVVRDAVADLFGRTLDGMTAAHKFVPPPILAASKETQIAFLKALISCDGYFGGNSVTYTTASARLAKEVQMMLLNLGIVATRLSYMTQLVGWSEPRQYWDLSMFGTRARDFMQIVGTHRPSVVVQPSVKSSSSYLSVPFSGDALRQAITLAREQLGWNKNGKCSNGLCFPSTGLFSRKKHHGLSRGNALDLVERLDGWVDRDLLTRLRGLLATNYVFERVVSKRVIRGRQEVYDVHVPNGHLFWASGFINHNTLQAIEAAANFCQKHKKGKVRYREAESAFDKPYAEALGMPIDRVDFGSIPMETVEDMFEDLTKVIDQATGPELYILDSLDALSSRDEMARDMDEGSYGTEKAKKMSQLFRRLTQPMADKRVTLMIISQIRSKIGFTVGRTTDRQGGRSLDFYASQVLWLAQTNRLVRTVSGIKRTYGISILAKVDKNKVGIPFREAEFDIIFGYGVDDIRACLEWLQLAGSLSETGVAKEKVKGYTMSIQKWPDEDYYAELDRIHAIVDRRWREIETQFMPVRRKYE